jgi:hypothetical protein
MCGGRLDTDSSVVVVRLLLRLVVLLVNLPPSLPAEGLDPAVAEGDHGKQEHDVHPEQHEEAHDLVGWLVG